MRRFLGVRDVAKNCEEELQQVLSSKRFPCKRELCATCHGKHVGLLHVTFGPSVRSCSTRHWMFFEIHVSEVE